jgi:hypothetical protein
MASLTPNSNKKWPTKCLLHLFMIDIPRIKHRCIKPHKHPNNNSDNKEKNKDQKIILLLRGAKWEEQVILG